MNINEANASNDNIFARMIERAQEEACTVRWRLNGTVALNPAYFLENISLRSRYTAWKSCTE